MTTPRQSLVFVVTVFLAAMAGVWVGRVPTGVGSGNDSEFHDALHNELNLGSVQQAQLDKLEKRFAMRRKALELELRAGNAKLAAAIEAEHRYGPRVAEAVGQVHSAMGELQRATLEHTFAMRAILRPDQIAKFDDAVVKALTTDTEMTLALGECSDGELAALALAGRQAAYAELLNRHRTSVFRLVRGNIGVSEIALDLTQETFIAAFAALRKYDGTRPFKTWVLRIALNKCRDWARRQAVRRFLSFALPIEAAALVADDSVPADRQLADRAELVRVHQAIAVLPTAIREPLILRTIEGLSQAETAEVLGISEKAVETRLRRARAKLTELLEVQEMPSPSPRP